MLHEAPRTGIAMTDYTGRYVSYFEFVSPANSFECSPQHFLRVTPEDTIGVTQHVVHMRPVLQVAAIEDETGMPVVATDFCLYWAVLTAAGVPAKAGCGRLLGTIR